jgi:hypothetical protein
MKTLAKNLSLTALLTAFLFAGAAHAQTNDLPDPGMLPDSPFSFVESWSEGIGTFFTFGDVARAERHLRLSEERLSEASALANEEKPEAAERAVERYREQLDRALARADEARAEGGDTDEVLADVSEATLRHQAVLADVYEKVPEQARPGIERAMQASMRGHAQAMRGVSGQRRGEVMRDVEERRRQVNPRLEELRARGVPVPAMPSREEIERGPPDRPETGRPDAPGRRGPPARGREDTTVDSSGASGADADL